MARACRSADSHCALVLHERLRPSRVPVVSMLRQIVSLGSAAAAVLCAPAEVDAGSVAGACAGACANAALAMQRAQTISNFFMVLPFSVLRAV